MEGAYQSALPLLPTQEASSVTTTLEEQPALAVPG